MIRKTYNRAGHNCAASCTGFSTLRFARRRLRRYVFRAMRTATAILMLIPVLAIGAGNTESSIDSDFYITITANDLCLCGEGFGGIYGCIDEAISREVQSVVISASSEATVQKVQELISAVHSAGFEKVGFSTFYESDA